MGSGGGGAWLNMLDYTGAYTEDAKNMQESLERSGLLNGLGKVFLEYQWAPNDIAVYYSHNSMLLSFIRGKETNGKSMQAVPSATTSRAGTISATCWRNSFISMISSHRNRSATAD